jgi:hypothetical protein
LAQEVTVESDRFDRLTKVLSTGGTRRRLLAVLAALPLTAPLGDVLTGASVARAKKGKSCKLESRRKTCRGKCGIVRGNCRGPIDCGKCCEPEPKTTTCTLRCGPVKNNCGKTVDCGECGTCRADIVDCNCGGSERQCFSRPEDGDRLPSCVCDTDFCRFDGPLSTKHTQCCSCGPD